MANDALFRFSTAHLPARERVAMTRELFGRQMMQLELEPLDDDLFRADFTLQMIGDLGIVSAASSPMRATRSGGLLADGDDSFIVQIARCRGVAAQGGREAAFTPGDAVMLSNADAGRCVFPDAGNMLALRVPRAALRPRLRDIDTALVRTVPRDTTALRVLTQYLSLVRDQLAAAQGDLQHLFAQHVYDLLGLALGATRDAAAAARMRGLSAARLRAIKADILAHLGEDNLAVGAVARRQGISESYVRKLFESEDTSFTEFVLNERLARAYRILASPLGAGRPVSAVAFEVGFGDLSYFNRAFRRRFGATPSEVRGS